MKLFQNDLEGRFISRPNRYIVKVDTPLGIVEAHCPNPGRLREILTPGRTLFLERSMSTNAKRKTLFTLEAALYRKVIIPLHSARANNIAKDIILPQLFENADLVQPEATKGSSRFDFLIEKDNIKHYIEIKACTLVEQQTAMFPDSPTKRGLKHIEELSALNGKTEKGHIIIIIMNSAAKLFTPNIHTDPDFSTGIERASHSVAVHAVSIKTDRLGNASIYNRNVPIDFGPVSLVSANSGSYLLILHLQSEQTISVGKLGKITFQSGYYVYTGNAKKNLTQRIDRHRRRVKRKLHWHIDYLTTICDSITPMPIYSYFPIECALAQDLEISGGKPIRSFGSSDCHCNSHLFFFLHNPLKNPTIINMVFSYRHKKAISNDS
jgi:sugar fermentation stimulation protein A